jgi:hypothetical protein
VFSITTLPARAQSAAPSAPEDDAASLDPLEPDFALVNLPTSLRMPVRGWNFHLTHRFNENLRADSFSDQLSNLFGIDQGATIGLEFRIGIAPRLQAIASRTTFSRTIQFAAKYDAVHENVNHPVSLSAIVSVEGLNNFRETYSPAIGVVVSRRIAGAAVVYLVPMWVHNSSSAIPDQNTGYVGVGARIRFRPTAYLLGELSPRLGGYVIGDPEYAFAIEKRVGAHVFSLTFGNGQGTSYAQLARGGNPQSLYFGFNLTRKFF